MIRSLIPKVLAMKDGVPWEQLGEAYLVYTIDISAAECDVCVPSHISVSVIQSVSVSFTLNVGRDGLMNAPPMVAGVVQMTDEDINFLHTDTIQELIRNAFNTFNSLVTPKTILMMMQDVYGLVPPNVNEHPKGH